MKHDKDSDYIQNAINNKIDYWLDFNNKLFGFFGIGLAYSSLGMNDPRLFATWSLFFLIGAWYPTAKKMKDILKLCRETKHPALGYKRIFAMGLPYVIGLTTLVLVAFGLLTKEATFSNILPGI